MPKSGKTFSLGIFIDGQQLSCALLSKAGSRIQIELLENFNLEQQLIPQERALSGMKAGETAKDREKRSGDENPFELDVDFGARNESAAAISEISTNADVLLRVLHTMCPRASRLAFSLIDSYVLYKNIDNLQPSSPQKLKKAIWQDIFVEAPAETKMDNIGYLRNGKNRYLAIVHDDPLVFSSTLFEAMRIMRSRPPQVALIDTLEFALSHALVTGKALQEKQITAAVYFAQTFTKVIFFRGLLIEEVLPTIHEGADSEHVCETAYSKILFELDSGRIPVVNNLIVSGDVDRTRAVANFQGKFANVEVKRFDFSDLPLGHHAAVLKNRTAPWTAAIALAVKVLDDKTPSPYRKNFLPRRIRDRQSIYRVAWHGLLMLGLLFAGVLFLTFKLISGEHELKLLRHASSTMEMDLARLSLVAHEVDSLRAVISTFETGTALVDSLKARSVRWSPVLQDFSGAFSSAGPFALQKLTGSANGVLIAEVAINRRNQVAELERLIKPSTVLSVNSKEENRQSLVVTLECKGKSAGKAGQ
ncbi:MAG TPA: hypothetical protein PLN61_11015 [bacterium]|nr:hypothetical protein [bacterium]HQI49178.1 hypothetical protein [bacterium]HQJ64845.1 hypothetical protein [bacterium]